MAEPVNWRSYDGDGELIERAIRTMLHRRHPEDRRRRPSQQNLYDVNPFCRFDIELIRQYPADFEAHNRFWIGTGDFPSDSYP